MAETESDMIDSAVAPSPTLASSFPTPVTPLPPPESSSIETQRAQAAEAAAAAGISIDPDMILLEDDWLIAVQKPPGVYSEHILSAVGAMLTMRDQTTDVKRPNAESAYETETPSGVPVVREFSGQSTPPPDGNLGLGGKTFAAKMHSTSSKTAPDGSSTELSVSPKGLPASTPFLVHRLDRDTSGVLLLAKTAASAAKLGKAFERRDVSKSYLALCALSEAPVVPLSGDARSNTET
ncbi:unnamed protein product, partial [Closterium sp. NIES-54]